MNLNIRPMTIDDAHEVARIHTHSWQTAYKGIIDQNVLDALDVEKRAQGWANGMKNDPSLIRLVAETQEALTGFVVGLNNRSYPNPDSEGELWAIYIDPSVVSRGIGTSLFKAFQHELRNKKMKSMCVWVLEENIQARGFYQKMGGRLTSDKKTFKAGDKEHLEVCYVFGI